MKGNENILPYQHSIPQLNSHATGNAPVQPESTSLLTQYKNGIASTLASQGSTGSKTSTASSMSSATNIGNCNSSDGNGSRLKIPVIFEAVDRERQMTESKSSSGILPKGWSSHDHHVMDPNVPNTEDPELLNKLQFVSPKTGVFRPVESACGGSTASRGLSLGRGVKLKKQKGCLLM